MTDEESFFAYLDGELDGEARDRIAAAIDADPSLQAMEAEHRAMANRLQSAFSTVVEESVPRTFLVTAAAGSNVILLAEERARREPRATWDLPRWAAMAATLVAGVIGGVIVSGGHGGPVIERGGRLVAAGQLERALDTQLASAQNAQVPFRIGLTFRNHGGQICRSFAAEATEGVACRADAAWQLQGLLAVEEGRTGDYRMAASPATSELVDRLIVGEALNGAQERAALAADWTRSRFR